MRRDSVEYKMTLLLFVLELCAVLVFTAALCIAPGGGDVPVSADTTPPEIIGAGDIKIYVGESPAYRKGITLADDSGADGVTLEVDSSKADISKPGRYPITYIALDRAGNSSSVTVYLTVEVYFPQRDELNAALDRVISSIITDDMNVEQKVRQIYDYVQNHIAFVNTSNKTSWEAEAYLALFVTNTGDCFSYFAASKAFFERLGIENLDIQRPDELAAKMQQTHYWSLVNISDPSDDGSASPRWYHYDSCRLRAEYNHSGCLLTERQTNAYNKVREHFYAYDKTGYPAVSTTIITPTPELEPYYDPSYS